jgi:hypothetical protein
MSAVTTSDIVARPNEVIVTLTSENGPVRLDFSAYGAAVFARDMSVAAARALKLNQQPKPNQAQGLEELVAPRATLEDYGQDTQSGDVILRLRDEQGVLHVFRVDPNEINEFAQSALLHTSNQSDDEASH